MEFQESLQVEMNWAQAREVLPTLGSLSEMQNLRAPPDTGHQNLHFDDLPCDRYAD